MVHVLRQTYSYLDEYIMEKPLLWIQNSYELCMRDRHDERIALARTILHEYACAMSGDKGGYLKSYSEMAYEQKNADEGHSNDDVMAPERMPAWGLGYKKRMPKKENTDKSIENS